MKLLQDRPDAAARVTRARAAAAVFMAVLLPTVACAQGLVRTPLPANHPLLGAWRINVPNKGCHEVYRIRADGTMRVTSGQQMGESEFDISLQPTAKGFYRWVDHILKDNGKPDCMGSVMTVGAKATNFIKLHPDGKLFVMCQTEELAGCVGPFIRQDSDK